MSKQIEALKLALEALEVLGWQPTEEAMDYRDNAIDAIHEALASQPAQQREPVALDVTIEGDSAKLLASMLEPVLDDEPTPIRLLVGNGHSGHGLYVAAAEYQEEGVVLLVNTSPPASKPWVGLTDEEFAAMWMRSNIYGTNREKAIALGRAIEAKLREKNAPASKPLTQDMVESCPYHGETLRGAFFDGWIKAEAAHGIKE